jgi:DNA polymerase elongation subunit (family B)
MVRVDYNLVESLSINKIAPLLIAGFDIECTSSHGDFPVAKKDYKKLAADLVALRRRRNFTPEKCKEMILDAYEHEIREGYDVLVHQLYPKEKVSRKKLDTRLHDDLMDTLMEMLQKAATEQGAFDDDSDEESTAPAIKSKAGEMELSAFLTKHLPPLAGDALIQIGTTVHRYGSDEILYRHIISLGSCDEIDGAEVEMYDTEEEVIMAWRDFMQRLDPDILTGYNIFGFDMEYIWMRAEELGVDETLAVGLGRLNHRRCVLDERKLSSSALGDNIMKCFDMDGVVSIDMLKVMQRDHKLDSYKLDSVASIFLGDNKNDLKPHEIFEKFRGDSADRCEIARYCLQDCALVNRLIHKLKVLENNVGMGNVCSVPLSFLFMRGQGIKIFSLVAKECRAKQYLIPVLKGFRDMDTGDQEGYEGAIVLPPQEGIYLDDPITVLDYSSLYPSSMIARNLSHDCFVHDEQYANLQDQGITYLTVEYDVYEGEGDKKKVVGKKNCTFAQLPEGKKGIIPSILSKLLTQRKNTRKKIEYERLELSDGRVAMGLVKEIDGGNKLEIVNVDEADLGAGFGGHKATIDASLVTKREIAFTSFEQAVLDALQLAYKITANSLYGQIGSRTSPIYWKDIAACTTATGREMIMLAKNFAEKEYGAEIVYGDTDSVFIKFANYNEKGERVYGKDALPLAIQAGQRMSKEIKKFMPPPQSLEYEKTFYPFILFSKKRYVGNLYEDDPNKKPKQKSMGIVLKRRDNAQIVKKVYGGVIDIMLNKQNMKASVDFLREQLRDLVDGKYPLEDLIITKTLRAEYKDPTKIAHKVLAERMGERDPGNKPMVNERIPFVYIKPPPGVEVKLQGDRIEHPDYIREQNLTPDYRFYITNQLLKPICQLYALCVEQLPEYSEADDYWEQVEAALLEKPLYMDEKKRKDRVQALRMRMVEELLFHPYIAELDLRDGVEPKKPRKAASTKEPGKKKRSPSIVERPAEDCKYHMQVDVKQIKLGKEYEYHVTVCIPSTNTTTFQETLREKGNKQESFAKAIQAVIMTMTEKEPATNASFREDGLRVRADKTFIKGWKQAIQKRDTLYAEVENILAMRDIGKLKELHEMQRLAKLAKVHEELNCTLEEF